MHFNNVQCLPASEKICYPHAVTSNQSFVCVHALNSCTNISTHPTKGKSHLGSMWKLLFPLKGMNEEGLEGKAVIQLNELSGVPDRQKLINC